jgi:hypothetical protein
LWKTLAPSWGGPEAPSQQGTQPEALVNVASETGPRG